MLLTAKSSEECPSLCKCDMFAGLRRAKCVNKMLTSIEAGVPREDLGMVKLIVLNISNSGISFIEHDTFANVKLLKIVNLSYNRLHSIPQDLFETNTLLNSLNLAGNQFTSLQPGPFLESESLQTLNISRSLIPYFYPDNFSNLPRLSTLDISQNVLIQIEPQHFQSLTHLKVLKLSGNEWNCNLNMKKLVTFLKNNNVYFEIPCGIMEKSQKMIAIPEEPSEEIDKSVGWINDCDIELINMKNDTNTCTNICEWHHYSLMLLIATFICGALVGILSLILITSFPKMLKRKERNKLGEQYLMKDFNDCGLSTPVLNRIQRH
ncbi:uncharacterized protein CBL_13992 [Carabus blaptoides fortunei]